MNKDDERDKKLAEMGWKDLHEGIVGFLAAQGQNTYDEKLTKRIGNFILALTSVAPTIPMAGKKLRDLSSKQRILFQGDKYEGTIGGEFLGNWVDKPEVYFGFSQHTVTPARNIEIVPPTMHHKIVSRLCHERPDHVISYEKLADAVPRFVRDMQGKMKYMNIFYNKKGVLTFENAEKPHGGGLWIRTEPVNVLQSVLDHQDVHVHLGTHFVIIYNRWFGAYFEGA